jgi:serine/threonine-protein kinase
VYALGAILFEILTRTPLHERSSIGAIVASTLEGVSARPSERAPDADVAPELEAICVRATALAPEDRYPTARALHDALERYLEGERDVELRREMARSHAERARAAVEREISGSGGLDERREAMREIGRALALDPDNGTALTTLMRLLTTPPTTVPPEVRGELMRSTYDQNRSTGRLGAFTYASIFLYLPLFFWIGIRDPWPLVWLFGGALATTALSVWVARERRPPTNAVLGAMVLSNLSFTAVSAFYGPLVVLPPVIVANTIAFAIHLDRQHKWLAMVSGCSAIVVPLALQALGVLPESYAFENGRLIVEPWALELRATPTLLFMTLASVASVITGSLVVGGVRTALREAEERLYLYAWHLRETVPERARPATDPTRARRSSPGALRP